MITTTSSYPRPTHIYFSHIQSNVRSLLTLIASKAAQPLVYVNVQIIYKPFAINWAYNFQFYSLTAQSYVLFDEFFQDVNFDTLETSSTNRGGLEPVTPSCGSHHTSHIFIRQCHILMQELPCHGPLGVGNNDNAKAFEPTHRICLI